MGGKEKRGQVLKKRSGQLEQKVEEKTRALMETGDSLSSLIDGGSDEPDMRFLRCTKCRFTWREYD